MTLKRKTIGINGEEIAAAFLKKKGCKILKKNYRCYFGEVDIVALCHDTLCFVEVKTRTSHQFGTPQESVIPAKQKKLSKIALEYIQKHKLEEKKARFDIIAVNLSGKNHSIDCIENAFDLVL